MRVLIALFSVSLLLALGGCETHEALPARPDLVMRPGQRLSLMSDEAISAGMRPTLNHRSRNTRVVAIEFETRPDGFRVPVLVARQPGIARIDAFAQSSHDPLIVGETDMITSVSEATSRIAAPTIRHQRLYVVQVVP